MRTKRAEQDLLEFSFSCSGQYWRKGCVGRHRLTLLHAVQADRRAALVGLAAIPAVLAAKPAEAAYGDAANVFGKTTNTSGTPSSGSSRDVDAFVTRSVSVCDDGWSHVCYNPTC
jgi:hypothetical protein